jgi:hypothetical protein
VWAITTPIIRFGPKLNFNRIKRHGGNFNRFPPHLEV